MTASQEEFEGAGVARGLAHAKVNLALSVGAPDPERGGFHPICGLFSCVSLADAIELARAEATSLETRWASDAPRPSLIDWDAERDLSVRALSGLEALVGESLPTRIRITKRIPVGGGLGGGSADAAMTLLLAARCHGVSLDHESAVEIGRGLGSDVAFFLDADTSDGGALGGEKPARPAIVGGLGERVERLPGPIAGSLLLLFPWFGCSTPSVYRAFDAEPTTQSATLPRDLDDAALRSIASTAQDAGALAVGGELFNDLTRPAIRAHPELGGLIERAESALERAIHMSGSGSTLFCVVEAGDEPDRLRSVAQGLGVASRVVDLI